MILEPKRWLYGYVFYRQNRDSSIHRGYLQKSVAILSENNLVDFYQRVVAVIGETYFEYGEKALDMAWKDILAWPTPQLNQMLVFPLLGKVIKFPMPTIRNGSFIFTPLPSVLDAGSKEPKSGSGKLSSSSKGEVSKRNFGPDLKISPSIVALDDRFLYTVPVYAPLSPVISKIWTLWELLLLGSPILVLSPAPGLSSDAVLALASLLSPLEFKGDYRPFFTIHDSDFKIFSDDMEDPAEKFKSGLILGGTNPYFFKALEHWKNIITLSGRKRHYKTNPFLQPTIVDPEAHIDESANKTVGLIEYNDHVQAKGYHTVFPSGIDFKKYMKKPSKDENPEACYIFNEKFIRYHLHLRTTAFLAPLRHFFDRLVSSKSSSFKPLHKIPLIGELTPAVIDLIKTHLQPARSAPEIKFYDSFISTPTFKRWFNKKQKIANDKLINDYITFLNGWRQTESFDGLGEMELVNMYQEASDQLKKEGEMLGTKGSFLVKSIMEEIVKHLDADLQAAIRMKESIPQAGKNS